MASFRSFAIIPAAGTSSRMGQRKLLLPWGDSTMIETALSAWRLSGVKAMVVVVPPDDPELADVCWNAGAEVVVAPRPPADMKQSVLLGLRHVQHHLRPRDEDAWLLAPGDIPQISPVVIGRLLDAHKAGGQTIFVPKIGQRRGHPVLLPWTSAAKVADLAANEGLNVLVAREAAIEVECDDIATADSFGDIDTPEEYDQGKERPS